MKEFIEDLHLRSTWDQVLKPLAHVRIRIKRASILHQVAYRDRIGQNQLVRRLAEILLQRRDLLQEILSQLKQRYPLVHLFLLKVIFIASISL